MRDTQNDTKKNSCNGNAILPSDEKGLDQPLSVGVDFEKYQHFLDESDLNDEEKKLVVQTLWGVIVNFVDLGIGVHPIQQAGLYADTEQFLTQTTIQVEFEHVANLEPNQHPEGVDA